MVIDSPRRARRARRERFAATDAKGADETPAGELYQADRLVEGRVLVENTAVRGLAPGSATPNPGRLGRQLPDRKDRKDRMNSAMRRPGYFGELVT